MQWFLLNSPRPICRVSRHYRHLDIIISSQSRVGWKVQDYSEPRSPGSFFYNWLKLGLDGLPQPHILLLSLPAFSIAKSLEMELFSWLTFARIGSSMVCLTSAGAWIPRHQARPRCISWPRCPWWSRRRSTAGRPARRPPARLSQWWLWCSQQTAWAWRGGLWPRTCEKQAGLLQRNKGSAFTVKLAIYATNTESVRTHQGSVVGFINIDILTGSSP